MRQKKRVLYESWAGLYFRKAGLAQTAGLPLLRVICYRDDGAGVAALSMEGMRAWADASDAAGTNRHDVGRRCRTAGPGKLQLPLRGVHLLASLQLARRGGRQGICGTRKDPGSIYRSPHCARCRVLAGGVSATGTASGVVS